MIGYLWIAGLLQLALSPAFTLGENDALQRAAGHVTNDDATCVNQESTVSDGPSVDQFKLFWSERFGPKRVDPDIHPLEFVSYESHTWRFDTEFSETFPRLKEALCRSNSFSVTYRFPGLPDQRNLFVFWRSTDGAVLTWVLDPPVDRAQQKAAQLELPSLGRLWQQFGGFDNVSTWYMGDRDLPNAAAAFTGLFDNPTSEFDDSRIQLFQEFCDDLSFHERLKALRNVGDDSSGNHLAIEPESELLFCLSRDGDFLGRRGVRTKPIGSGDTSVYIIVGAETPAKFLELCAEHILKQLPPATTPSAPP
jgi:hypothetical protein